MSDMLFIFEMDGLNFTITVSDANDTIVASIQVLDGHADFNALYWSDGDATGGEGGLSGFVQKKDASLNMNGARYEGENILWDGGLKLSSAGLGTIGTDKPTYLSAGQSYEINLSALGVTSIDQLTYLGIRATSTSTFEGSIKIIVEGEVPELPYECPTGAPLGEITIVGTSGDDTLIGLDDYSNFIVGNGGSDTIHGAGHADTILGNGGDDIIFGHCGDDLLMGGRDSDIIYGGNGNDRIEGDLGADQLTGGNGADAFVFRARHFDGDGIDVILDYIEGIDKVVFIGIDSGQISLVQNGVNAEIYVSGALEVIINNAQAHLLTASLTYDVFA